MVIQISILNGDFHMVLLLRTKKKSSLSTLSWSASNKGKHCSSALVPCYDDM